MKSTFSKNRQRVKIKPRGKDKITYDKTEIDLRDLEQLIDSNQTNTICFMLEFIQKYIVDEKITLPQAAEKIFSYVSKNGLDAVSPFRGHPGNMALPRKYEVAAVLNRFRNLKVK